MHMKLALSRLLYIVTENYLFEVQSQFSFLQCLQVHVGKITGILCDYITHTELWLPPDGPTQLYEISAKPIIC